MGKTCKDCVSYDACLCFCTERVLLNRGICDLFKDRSRFVEFPCAIGDTIFRVADFLSKTDPIKYRVSGLTVKKDKTIKIKLSDNIGVFEITKADIGKSFFLTYEDAKSELDRRMNDGDL